MNAVRKQWLAKMSCHWKYYFSQGKRHLYSSSSLGIDSFISHRKKVTENNPNINVIKKRLRQISNINSGSLVLLDDLQKLVTFAETEEDLELLIDLLKKYDKQREVVLFQGYTFGPQIMRLLYIMNKPKEATMLIEDENLFQYFQNFTTILLLLDMLFKNNMYEEVITFYRYFDVKLKSDMMSLHNSLGLVFLAACCKLNTPESFEEALQAQMLCIKKKITLPMRNALLFANLAINHDQPHCAIKILMEFKFNSMVKNLKLMAYAKAKRFDYVMELGTNILGWANKGHTFITNETLSFVEKELENDEDVLEFQQLKEKFGAQNIIIDEPLDKFLFEEVDLPGKKTAQKIPPRFVPLTQQKNFL